MTTTRSDPGVGYRFRMEVDGLDLTFTKVEGLGAKYDMLTVKEGGENGYVHKLPGRLSYDDVKLTRPVDDKSGQLSEWFTGRRQGVNATISALDGADNVIASWTLTAVFPHTYSGPSFKAGASEVLIETLTMSHQGFWNDAGTGVGAGSGGAAAGGLPSPAPALGGGSGGGEGLGGATDALGAAQEIAGAAEDLSNAESPQDVVGAAGDALDAAEDIPGTEETDEALSGAQDAVDGADDALDAADDLPTGGEG